MKITDVKVFPVDEDKLKAYATITFNNCFIVRDLKVISGNKGYFIAMPSKKRKDGTFRDVAHPLNSETRKMIEDAVLEVYEKENVTDSTPMPSHQDDDAVAGSDPTGPEGGTVGEADAVDTSEGEAPEAAAVQAVEEGAASDNTVESEITETAAEPIEGEAAVEDTPSVEPDQPEAEEKGAEENPVIEPSDDPEKAFGYEEK
jgi:stage V sporulation protein G